MTYRAKMQDGEVKFEGGIKPADGVELRVEIMETLKEQVRAPAPDTGTTLGERLMKFSGIMKGFPADSSVNLDHYLYGHPTK